MIIYTIGVFFVTVAWFSSNTLLFIEKCIFISNAIPPWVTWGIFGLIIGVIIASYKEAPRYRKGYLRPLILIIPLLIIIGLGVYNMNRLQRIQVKTKNNPIALVKSVENSKYEQVQLLRQVYITRGNDILNTVKTLFPSVQTLSKLQKPFVTN